MQYCVLRGEVQESTVSGCSPGLGQINSVVRGGCSRLCVITTMGAGWTAVVTLVLSTCLDTKLRVLVLQCNTVLKDEECLKMRGA